MPGFDPMPVHVGLWPTEWHGARPSVICCHCHSIFIYSPITDAVLS